MTRRLIGLIITLALSALVMPLGTAAQQPAVKVYRIGSLRVGEVTRVDESAQFQDAMRWLGYVPGQNLFFETRNAERPEQLPALAAELVTRQVDLMMTYGGPATRAAQQATSTIPIVFFVSDVLALQDFDVQRPETFKRFFAVAQGTGADAVLLPDVTGLGNSGLSRLGELAAQSRLPAISSRRTLAASGGLLSYEAQRNVSRLSAPVDKILRGIKPADIPVEHAMGFELVINLKTAAQLGLTIPPSLLFQATEVLRC